MGATGPTALSPSPTSALAFHSHAMTRLGDGILVATSAWRAGFQRSGDRGLTWSEAYDHPTPTGRVSRVVELESLGDSGHSVPCSCATAMACCRATGRGPLATPGWPENRAVRALAALDGRVYGLVRGAGGTALWRSDGRISEPLAELPQGGQARDLTADGQDLWLLTRVRRGRRDLAQSGRRRLDFGAPRDRRAAVELSDASEVGSTSVVPARMAKAGSGVPEAAGGGGSAGARRRLPSCRALRTRSAGAGLGARGAAPGSDADRPRQLRALRPDLARFGLRSGPAGPARGFLRRAASELVMPERRLSLIGGAVEIPAAKLGRWILLWGMAVAGQGAVPVDAARLCPGARHRTAPRSTTTRCRPLFWAIGEIGQRDRDHRHRAGRASGPAG